MGARAVPIFLSPYLSLFGAETQFSGIWHDYGRLRRLGNANPEKMSLKGLGMTWGLEIWPFENRRSPCPEPIRYWGGLLPPL